MLSHVENLMLLNKNLTLLSNVRFSTYIVPMFRKIQPMTYSPKIDDQIIYFLIRLLVPAHLVILIVLIYSAWFL